MRTRQEVTTIVAELCSRIALLFPQDKIEAILFGSYARGDADPGSDIDVLILVFAVFVITVGGFKLAMSAQKVFSALLGIPRSLVYAMAPVSGLFIIVAQIINIYEDVTGITIEGGNEE